MPSTGEDPAIGEGIASFLKVTLGIIKGFRRKARLIGRTIATRLAGEGSYFGEGALFKFEAGVK